MEGAQRELIGVLLGYIRSLGLISDRTCSRAMDLVHSAMDLPELFRDPACLTKEADECGCAQDT